jgi:4-hydroxy 2-oxovalerate aldolase|tara:strand:+ start:609 stop:2240 length:1632 start_codon:yes stop_codon:yes gene_type:complete
VNKQNTPYLLDCTLRDGGYYNQWDFDEELVSKYLQYISLTNIDIVEIGFRFFKSTDYYGPFGFCSESFLKQLDIDPDLKIAVMINVSEIIDSEKTLEHFKNVFIKAVDSRVDIVRVATYLSDVGKSEEIIRYLKSQGYMVCLNLMQIGEKTNLEIEKTIKKVNQWKSLPDVLYVADSLGNFDFERTKHLISLVSSLWNGSIGFHAHNNQGKAMSNTIVAMQNNAQFLDSTILGMGRGAGNAATESLMMEINEATNGLTSYDPKAIFPLVVDEFERLKQEYGWGHSLLYEVSSRYSVHPTYIQEILYKQDKYSSGQILRSLDTLVNTESNKYSNEIAASLLDNEEISEGSWDATAWLKDKDILIIGAGSEAKRNSMEIQKFIHRKKPITLSLNINPFIPEEYIDAYVIVNRIRLVTELNKNIPKNKKIILPISNLPPEIKAVIKEEHILDYGCNTSSGVFQINKNYCVIPYELAIAYALSLVSIGQAKNMFLAGFDGFSPDDRRQDQMLEVWSLFKSVSPNIQPICLTKTNYPLKKKTLHDLSI